jgi:hypothetical protein
VPEFLDGTWKGGNVNKSKIIHSPVWKNVSYGFLGAFFFVFFVSRPALALEKMTGDTAGQTEAPALSSSSQEPLAEQAGDDFKGGTKSLGSGFKKGAQVTGGAFKKAGVTVGRAFKKAGVAIKEFFAGKKDSEVEEKDISETAEPDGDAKPEPVSYDKDLDSLGDG